MNIKFLFGLGVPRIANSNLSRAFKEGNRVHDISGISPALKANQGGYSGGSQLIMEIKQVNKPIHSNDRVYDSDGISPTLNAMQGGNRQPFVKINESVKIKKINNPVHSNNEIYDIEGISPALTAMQGGNRQPFILNRKEGIKKEIETAVTLSASDWRGLNRNQDQNAIVENGGDVRIRKLTPVECERLMAYPDDYTRWGKDTSGRVYEMSNSRRYKHCGNGIVSTVSKHFVESLILGDGHKIMSICSGVDGSCLALDKTRFETVGFCEFDKYASDTLRYHYPDIPNFNDLTKLNVADLPQFDILFASLPCQSFSIAGQRRGLEDTRGTLFYDMARILKERSPKYFVFENVKGLLSHDKGKTFEIILETFCELGYDVDFEVLNAKYFGVAQNRERVFLLGVRK